MEINYHLFQFKCYYYIFLTGSLSRPLHQVAHAFDRVD
jgi:hypothetical protein